MQSIRPRLLAAFGAIILVVVGLVSLALLLLLLNHPVAERFTLSQLSATARLAVRQAPPPLEQTAQADYVRRLAETSEVRVLLIAGTGRVLADSEAETNNPLTWRPAILARLRAAGVYSGRTLDAHNRVWLCAGQAVNQDLILALAEPRPRLLALTFFGENLIWPVLEAGAVAAVLAAALAVLIARSIARPLQHMAGVAQAIARGDYARTAPESGPTEVRALGQALNQMARQVQASQQTQRDFLANVSHELKTPLTSIQGFAQAMVDGAAATPAAVQHSAEIIYTEADRMRHLVEELLDLARLEAGLRDLRRAPLELPDLLAACVEKLSFRAQAKGVEINTDWTALPTLLGDAEWLAQVFANLLDNALKHTPAGGRITLTAAAQAADIVVAVADTGPGIPAEELPRIFERFYQVDKARAHSGGVGLGLAITREIVEAHGGQVRAESVVGLGTKITVVLPVARPAAPLAAQKHK